MYPYLAAVVDKDGILWERRCWHGVTTVVVDSTAPVGGVVLERRRPRQPGKESAIRSTHSNERFDQDVQLRAVSRGTHGTCAGQQWDVTRMDVDDKGGQICDLGRGVRLASILVAAQVLSLFSALGCPRQENAKNVRQRRLRVNTSRRSKRKHVILTTQGCKPGALARMNDGALFLFASVPNAGRFGSVVSLNRAYLGCGAPRFFPLRGKNRYPTHDVLTVPRKSRKRVYCIYKAQ